MNWILKEIGKPAALEQLAEELIEAAHAALKLARILRKENPTPASETDTRNALQEEIGDINLCLTVLEPYVSLYHPVTKATMLEKGDRWRKRLDDAKKVLTDGK